jgi:hypothetical protein
LGLHVLGVTTEATADHYGAATIAAHGDQSRAPAFSLMACVLPGFRSWWAFEG